MDAVELMWMLDGESVDCIFTDPAYESINKHRYGAESCLRLRRWFESFLDVRYAEFFAAAYRVLKRDSHLYMMCDETTLDVIKPIGRDAGFRYWKAVVWDKYPNGGGGMGYHYRDAHEYVAFFEKGKRKLRDLGRDSTVRIPMLRNNRKRNHYPTRKPPELIEYFITNSTSPGEIVLDPFSGSGSSGVAALLTGRKYIGGDIADDAIIESDARLQALEDDPWETSRIVTRSAELYPAVSTLLGCVSAPTTGSRSSGRRGGSARRAATAS